MSLIPPVNSVSFTFTAKDEQLSAFSQLEKKAQESHDPLLQIQALLALGTLHQPAFASKSLIQASNLLLTEPALKTADDRTSYIEQLNNSLRKQFGALIEANQKLSEELSESRAEIERLKRKPAEEMTSPPVVAVVEKEVSAVTQSWQNDIELLQNTPKTPQTLIHLALAQLESNQYEKVKETCLEYLKEGGDKNNWQLWFMLAKAAFELKDYSAANNFIVQCPASESKREEMVQLTAKIEESKLYKEAKQLYREKKTKAAQKKFIKANASELFRDVRNEIFHYNAMCYLRLNAFENALWCLDRAIDEAYELKKDPVHHYKLKADTMILIKNFSAARNIIKKLKEQNPGIDLSDYEKRLPSK